MKWEEIGTSKKLKCDLRQIYRIYSNVFSQFEIEWCVRSENFNKTKNIGDAKGLIGVLIENYREPLPQARKIGEIDPMEETFAEEGEHFVSVVNIDFAVYRITIDDKAVRRNVTLPNWLNQETGKSLN